MDTGPQKLIIIRSQIRKYGWEKFLKLIIVRRTIIWTPSVRSGGKKCNKSEDRLYLPRGKCNYQFRTQWYVIDLINHLQSMDKRGAWGACLSKMSQWFKNTITIIFAMGHKEIENTIFIRLRQTRAKNSKHLHIFCCLHPTKTPQSFFSWVPVFLPTLFAHHLNFPAKTLYQTALYVSQ